MKKKRKHLLVILAMIINSSLMQSQVCNGSLFNDNYATNTGWTQSAITNKGGAISIAGNCSFTNLRGDGYNRVFKSLTAPLPNNGWTAECVFNASAGNAPGHYIMAFTSANIDPTSLDRAGAYAVVNNDAIYVSIGAANPNGNLNFSTSPTGNNPWTFNACSKNDAGGTVSSSGIQVPSLNTNYYIRLQRISATAGMLSVFSDAGMTQHIPQSPQCFTIDANITNLSFIQHGVMTWGNTARMLSATIDDAKVCPFTYTPSIAGPSSFCVNAPLTFTGSSTDNNITNTFWEIAQSDASGNVIPGGYVWNKWYPGIPGAFTFPSNVTTTCGNYYKIKMAIQNKCIVWVETNKVIYISCPPAITVSGAQTVCGTSGTILTASGGTSYSWSPSNQTGNPVIVHPGTDCAPNCASGTTTYTVTGISNGCPGTSTITVNVSPQSMTLDLSTGVSSPGVTIASGTVDPDWKIRGLVNNAPYTGTFSSLTSATVVNPIPLNTWASSPNEKWITSQFTGPDPTTLPPASLSSNINTPKYYYWYENRFTFPQGLGYTNYSLNITEATADNDAFIYLNNPSALTSNSVPADINLATVNHDTFLKFYGPFTINNQAKFVQGENVLLAGIYNLPSKDWTPTGFIMRGSVTASCPIVEPCLAPVIAAQGGKNVICPGNSSVILNITPFASGNTVYWEKKDCNGGFTQFAGPLTSSSYTITSGNGVGTSYRARVICTRNGGTSQYSNIITVYQFPSSCNGPLQMCDGPMGSRLLADGITESKDTEQELESIYPNPFNENVNVVYKGEGVVNVQVLDVFGKVIATRQGNAKENIELDMTNTSTGIYFVKITAEGNTIMKKIVKK